MLTLIITYHGWTNVEEEPNALRTFCSFCRTTTFYGALAVPSHDLAEEK